MSVLSNIFLFSGFASCFLSCGLISAATIQVENTFFPFSTSSQSGTFEIFITTDTPVESNIVAHQLRIDLAESTSGIMFITAGATTERAYLGPSNAPTVFLSVGQVDAGDFTLSAGTPLVNEAGLVQVGFTLPASLPVGHYGLQLEEASEFTFLIDENNQDLELSVQDGSIRVIFPGDYDIDDDVDGADFLAWQRSYGRTGDVMADGNQDGVVNAADLTVWRDNFGSKTNAHNFIAVVPEPKSIWSLIAFFHLLLICDAHRFSRIRSQGAPRRLRQAAEVDVTAAELAAP